MEREGENEILLIEAERDSKEIPCLLTPTSFFSSLRSVCGSSRCSSETPAIGEWRWCFLTVSLLRERFSLSDFHPSLRRRQKNNLISPSKAFSFPLFFVHLEGGSLLIKFALHFEDSIELIGTFLSYAWCQNCFWCDQTGIPGFFIVDQSSFCDAFPPSLLVVDRNQYCPFSFPHMPPCLPEYSFLRSIGSALTRQYPRTWSTGSAAARASASRRAGSGEVAVKITQIATAAPSGPVRSPEMEKQVAGVRQTEVHGSPSRGYLCIPPSAPTRGERMSDCIFKSDWWISMPDIQRWIEKQL